MMQKKKICTLCEIELDVNEFEKTKNNYRAECKSCRKRKRAFLKYKRNADKRKYEFLLTRDNFYELYDNECFYCSEKPACGIDRMNNKVGYIIYNCAPCCYNCNFLKGNMDRKEFLDLVYLIYRNVEMKNDQKDS